MLEDFEVVVVVAVLSVVFFCGIVVQDGAGELKRFYR